MDGKMENDAGEQRDMAQAEMAIFTNMCMVTDPAGQLLIQIRNDPHWPGAVFPGGHVEPWEPFTNAIIREVWEETGLTIENPQLCGLKQFKTAEGARYVVFLYRTDQYTGELRGSPEGEVRWVTREELESMEMPRGFHAMLPLFFGRGVPEMHHYDDLHWVYLGL